MRGCWNRQTGKLEVLVSVLACGFKSHFPHQCKGHSIFRVSFIFYIRQISKLLSSKTVTLESHEIFDFVEAELVPQREIFDFAEAELVSQVDKGKPQVPQSVLACGFKSHFPHQCKGHSIFECPLFLYPAKKRKLQYIYIQNLFIFKQQFIFTYFRSKITVIILSVPIIGLITQYIDKLLSNGFCKYVYEYNNSNRNNSFLFAIITFKCYNTH